MERARIWVDVGGTFTDCFVSDADGRRGTKLLSTGLVHANIANADADFLELDSLPATSVENFWCGASVSLIRDGEKQSLGKIVEQAKHRIVLDVDISGLLRGETLLIDASLEAPVLAARLLLGTPLNHPLGPIEVRLGTTRGTNALLTRRGAKTALLVTKGFADVLRIGEQDRPDLFALSIQKPVPLTQHVVEVNQRMNWRGEVLTDVDRDQLTSDLNHLRSCGTESLAICLLHSHVNDQHERVAEQIASQIGFENISRSSEVAPLIKLVSRAETTTLDAYLNPILAGYVARVWEQFGSKETCLFRLMTSSGNLVAPEAFRGRDSILSGPAGGVVALAEVARRAGAKAAIGLDMGGTSTDVSRFEGRVGRRYESRVAGVRVMTPMMDIETVAAGGGSICDYIDGRLTVGPASAGADPGPACYGRGGPLTVTDVNLLLGRIPEERFPFALRLEAAEHRLMDIHAKIPSGTFDDPSELAEGFLSIAVNHMAEAVRTVSTAKGSDVREMVLVGFGGAAGQHLCKIADALGMKRIIDHPDGGMLSALGMGLADVGRVVAKGVYRLLDPELSPSIDALVDELRSEAATLLGQETLTETSSPEYRFEADVRYRGTEASLTLPLSPHETLGDRFHQRHQETFGYQQQNREIELVALRCEATLKTDAAIKVVKEHSEPSASSTRRSKVLDRAEIETGNTVRGPAMIASDHSTLLIEAGWIATVGDDGVIEIVPDPGGDGSPSKTVETTTRHPAHTDPVLLEVIARRLQGIADGMGEVLRRTAISVNVKERRDYSCAIFRADGALIANAPHVPVHLGAMGHCVRHIMRSFPAMSAGDCYVSNDPFAGGSHLPDVTLVTPVFCDERTKNAQPDFFVASRAHHAEIGGRTPGSMPPDATSLAEEGVLIRDFALHRNGVSYVKELRNLLRSGQYPSRSVDENLADIAAAQAAGASGVAALAELVQSYSKSVVTGMMERLLDVAANSMGQYIDTLPKSPMRFSDRLDDGSEISVTLNRVDDRLSIQFRTSPVHPNGFNATPAIVTSAVLYVLRVVSGSNLPLCDGVLRNVDLRIEPGLLDPPAHVDPANCAAVVAGNVETSQRVVDVLLGALGVAAASQGTMNNVLFGDETFGYYETIAGGSGATATHDGADAVHTHMTNTRITDPEVLESRLPVRLHRFAIRRGSGGQGIHNGGAGIIREFEFLRPLTLSLLTGRRTIPPYAVAGGHPGKPGRNILIHDGSKTELPPTTKVNVSVGDRLIIETPGGGGYGSS